MPATETIVEEFETVEGESFARIRIDEESGGTSWVIERRYVDGDVRRTSPMIAPMPYEEAFAGIMQRAMGA